MNSFIGWIGGKRALRNEILQRMPADIGRYIEVFGGAGWVLFGREPSSKVMEVFNDYDAELVNIYRCIKYHPDALRMNLICSQMRGKCSLTVWHRSRCAG